MENKRLEEIIESINEQRKEKWMKKNSPKSQ